jgi:hypothetical protein
VATKKSFRDALKEQLEARKKFISPVKRLRLQRMLDGKGPLAERRVRRAEAYARTHLEVDGGLKLGRGAIDWDKIDWEKFFAGLVELLMKLLPLLLAI